MSTLNYHTLELLHISPKTFLPGKCAKPLPGRQLTAALPGTHPAGRFHANIHVVRWTRLGDTEKWRPDFEKPPLEGLLRTPHGEGRYPGISAPPTQDTFG
jgi:hypothetical protein